MGEEIRQENPVRRLEGTRRRHALLSAFPLHDNFLLMKIIFLLIATFCGSALRAQQPDSAAPPIIQDNSFLVEEAYNQEAGIVQHISTFQMRRGSSDFDFVFTQEWPVRSVRHQLSYDIPISRITSRTGIGDVGINYRYQLIGDGTTRLAASPRLSLILPTGDWKESRGNGAVGFETNIPVSFVLTPWITTHSNVGGGFTPSARDSEGKRAGIFEWNLGQSAILTASSSIQPMLEVVYSRGSEVVGTDTTQRTEEFLISPGVRGAFNFASGLQIVPGIAFPLGVGPSNGERGVFLYLSFEHPFVH